MNENMLKINKKVKGRKRIFALAVTSILLIYIIVISFFYVLEFNKDSANALTDSTKAEYVDELTVTGNGQGAVGKVFNRIKLDELYGLLLGDNATYADIVTAANEKRSTPAGGIGGLAVGKNASDFSNNVVVKIGGINWIATVLTVDKANGDVVLTLWRENIPNDAAHKAAFCPWPAANTSSSSMNHTYPGSVYGTSYIRSLLLNGYAMTDGDGSAGNPVIVEYSTSASEKTTYTSFSTVQTANYEYDLFTNTNNPNNLTDFIVKPSKIAYQETQDRRVAYNNSSLHNTSPNDAYGTPTNGYNWNGTSGIQNKYAYSDWQYDYLWLPSIPETVATNNIFGCPTDLRVDNIASWLRTGAMGSTNRIDGIAAEGILTTNYVSVSTLGIRPAFHLNLTAAEESSGIPMTTPTEVTSTYNGEEQNYFNASGARVGIMRLCLPQIKPT